MQLNDAEMRTIREIQQDQAILNDKSTLLLRLVEGRHSLDPGAIGTTHQLDPEKGEVTKIQDPAKLRKD